MVRERGRTLTLIIRDNGRGITKAELASVESIGLLGMTERARLLGGRVTIAGCRAAARQYRHGTGDPSERT